MHSSGSEAVNGHAAINRAHSTASQGEVDPQKDIPDESIIGPIITALKIGTLMAQYTKREDLRRRHST